MQLVPSPVSLVESNEFKDIVAFDIHKQITRH